MWINWTCFRGRGAENNQVLENGWAPRFLWPLRFSSHYISLASTFLQRLDFSGDYISPAPRFLWRLHWAYYRWWECTYIVDFASVVGICRCTRNTFEAGEEPFRKRVERVAGQSFHDLPPTRGRMKPEEVFYSSKIGGLHIPFENPLPRGSFVRNGKSFLKGSLLHLLMVPAEIQGQYSHVYETGPPYRT
jgi:hypothetical protein